MEKEMFHPLNCLKVLKRISKYLPKLLGIIPNNNLKNALRFVPEAYVGGLTALADIQEYFNLDPTDISNGIIEYNSDVLWLMKFIFDPGR